MKYLIFWSLFFIVLIATFIDCDNIGKINPVSKTKSSVNDSTNKYSPSVVFLVNDYAHDSLKKPHHKVKVNKYGTPTVGEFPGMKMVVYEPPGIAPSINFDFEIPIYPDSIYRWDDNCIVENHIYSKRQLDSAYNKGFEDGRNSANRLLENRTNSGLKKWHISFPVQIYRDDSTKISYLKYGGKWYMSKDSTSLEIDTLKPL